MARYFQQFPFITYSLSGQPNDQGQTVRNIFFRVKIIDAIQQNALIYYPYYVKDNESAEDIAAKLYKDSNLYWVVFFANNIVNPWYDWPLSETSFINHLESKYGSVGAAQSLIDHYTLTVTKQDSKSGDITAQTVTIDQATYNTTPARTFQEVNLVDGTTVAVTTTTNIVYAYDNELAINEAKRHIQLLDKQYISEIAIEFSALCAAAPNVVAS